MLLVEIGSDFYAYGNADRLASRAGICPGNKMSAGKRKSGRTRKGSLYVSCLLWISLRPPAVPSRYVRGGVNFV